MAEEETKETTESEATSSSSFEDSLAELERLVQQMESGDLSLEQSLEAFERGIKLTRECQRSLSNAEQRVQTLIEQNGEVSLTDFQPSDAADAPDKEDPLEP